MMKKTASSDAVGQSEENNRLTGHELLKCDHCDRGPFKGKTGLSQHMRKAHPDEYHEKQAADTDRVKARWTQEETGIVARALMTMDKTGMKTQADENRALNRMFPHRTVDSFKGLRKTKAFQAACKALEGTLDVALDVDVVTSTPDVAEHTDVADVASLDVVPTMDENERQALAGLLASIDRRWLAIDSDVASMTKQELKAYVEHEGAAWMKTIPAAQTRKPKKRQRGTQANPMTKKGLRRHQYTRVQTLFRKDRGKGARAVMDGTWKMIGQDATEVDTGAFLDAWQRLMEEKGEQPDEGQLTGHTRLVPISEDEVRSAVTDLGDTANGPDGVTRRTLADIPYGSLATHFNLWLLAETLPEGLLGGRTVFIPKEQGTTDPMKFRPITIASVVTRAFHKTLVDRLADADDNPRQKGFKKGDGIAANAMLLQTIVEESKTNRRGFKLAFIDVAKEGI